MVFSISELKFWFVGTFRRSDTNQEVTFTYDASHDNYVLKKSGDPIPCIYSPTPEEYKLKIFTALSECSGFTEYITFSFKGFTINNVLYGRVH